ncbi:MAG TPA: DNA-binding protein [Geobacteraceae bacterium]|nr:DNA-binding protein [Geobacteraceae bacterium]
MRTNSKNNPIVDASKKNSKTAVSTFGGLNVYYDEVPVSISWESQKARLLFCCLLVTSNQWVHRQKIIDAVWPGCSPASGEKNFKTTLSRLRKSFSAIRGLTPVLAQGEAIRLNYLDIAVDASEFRTSATQGIKLLVRGEIPSSRKYLEAAQDLYLGDFLPEEPNNSFISSARLEYAEIYASVIKSLEKSYLLEGNMDALEIFSLLKNVPSLNLPCE